MVGLVWRFYPDGPLRGRRAPRPAWFHIVSRLLDILQLATGLYGGLALFALSRGSRWIRRPRLVTQSLGIAVWVMLPVTGGAEHAALLWQPVRH